MKKFLVFSFLAMLLIPMMGYGQATLPFSYDGGKPSGVTGLTQTGLNNTDYGSSPKMKFDNSGDNLILNFTGTPSILSFKIKWYPGTVVSRFPGDFEILQSSNGISYTTLQLYNSTNGTPLINVTTYTETFTTIDPTTRFLKWNYKTKSNGNIGIGAISLTAVSGSPNIIVGTLSSFGNITINNISPEQSYVVTGNNLTNNITVSPPVGFEVAIASGGTFVANPNSITLGSSGGTVYVRFAPTLIQSYSDNITHVSGATNANVPVSGIGLAYTVTHTGTIANFPNWTYVSCEQGSVSSDDYIKMFTDTSSLTTPIMNFASGIYKNLSFRARTFGGVSGNSADITISVSTNGGLNWSLLAIRTPSSQTFAQMTDVDISAYTQSNVKLKFETLGATGSIGIGIDNIGSEGVLPITLQSFVGQTIENNVNLNWKTTTETNNSGFEIYRDNVKVGFVKGKGTTNEVQSYTYTDKDLQSGKYNYKLKQIDYNGNFEYYNLANAVEIKTPNKFTVNQNYPNPFNPVTKISYTLPLDTKVEIKIFDVIGKEIFSLTEIKKAGYNEFNFDGTKLSSGIYFYKITAGDVSKIRKMILIK